MDNKITKLTYFISAAIAAFLWVCAITYMPVMYLMILK